MELETERLLTLLRLDGKEFKEGRRVELAVFERAGGFGREFEGRTVAMLLAASVSMAASRGSWAVPGVILGCVCIIPSSPCRVVFVLLSRPLHRCLFRLPFSNGPQVSHD